DGPRRLQVVDVEATERPALTASACEMVLRVRQHRGSPRSPRVTRLPHRSHRRSHVVWRPTPDATRRGASGAHVKCSGATKPRRWRRQTVGGQRGRGATLRPAVDPRSSDGGGPRNVSWIGPASSVRVHGGPNGKGVPTPMGPPWTRTELADRKSTRLNSSH